MMVSHKIENLNRQITTKDTDVVIRKLSTKVSLGQDIFTGEFYQTFNIINASFSNSSKNLKRKKYFKTNFVSYRYTETKAI